MAMRSAALMEKLRSDVPLQYSFAPAGKLVLLSGAAQLEAARRGSEFKKEHGCETQVLGMVQACEIEPALAAMRSEYVGAIYSKHDHVADANVFSKDMRFWLESNSSVSFLFGDVIRKIVATRGKLQSIELASGLIEVDAAVACLGVWSPKILRPLGIDPRIYPVRGYSVTLPPGTNAPSVSVTDLGRRLLISRLDGRMRFAGFADFMGFDSRRDRARINQMIDIARSIAPDAAEYDTDNRQEWGGFRPMTPDGRPRVGPTPIEGLFLNTGHGTLGWTLTCATGHDVAGHVNRFLS
jgi:D-amino-acid dehydrogenase